MLSWTPPRGGLLALLKYNLPVDSLTLADTLANDYSVMLAPGSVHGFTYTPQGKPLPDLNQFVDRSIVNEVLKEMGRKPGGK